MYPFIRLREEKQKKVFRFFILILVALFYLWFALESIESRINCQIVVINTEKVLSDSRAVKVDRIDKDDTVYLKNGEKLNGKTIKEYANIKKGTGTYVIREANIMGRELTDSQELDLVFQCIVLYIAACIICILLMIQMRGYGHILVKGVVFFTYLLGLFILSDISLGYYSRNILGKELYWWVGCSVVFVAYIAYIVSIVKGYIRCQKKK